MKMCGYKTREVFDRYNIISGDDLRALVRGTHFFQPLGSEASASSGGRN
jgi:hypothetical protein